MELFDTVDCVLSHMSCQPKLWVSTLIGAKQRMGMTWWKYAHTTYLQGMPLERITWPKFREIYYAQYFSSIVQNWKKIEFGHDYMGVSGEILYSPSVCAWHLCHRVRERGRREICCWFEIEYPFCGIVVCMRSFDKGHHEGIAG